MSYANDPADSGSNSEKSIEKFPDLYQPYTAAPIGIAPDTTGPKATQVDWQLTSHMAAQLTGPISSPSQ